MKKYPVPEKMPSYVRERKERKKKPYFYVLFDKVFSAYALILSLVFSAVLVVVAVKFQIHIRTLFLFWVFLTYLALPRFHRLFTMLYLPDYFLARTKTGDGILGDPVNLALRGTEEDIRAAFLRIGFAEADPITLRSSAGIIKSTLLKTSYPEAPVSNLYLFDRRQDFAYQKEVDGSAVARHHIRFWRVPEGWTLPGGVKADYLAAGTFDRGVGLSTATLQVTHKIDENIDHERDFIISLLQFQNPDIQVSVIANFQPSFHDKNGGGDPIRTDGHMPIVDLSGLARKFPPGPRMREPEKGVNRELPPPSLAFAGAFLLVKMVLACLIACMFLFGKKGFANSETAAAFLAAAVYVLTFFLYVGVTRKKKWSRIMLLGIAQSSATVEVVTLAQTGAEYFWEIFSCAISVALVLILSSPDIRQWICEVEEKTANKS